MMRVVFLCVENSCRSQMAEGFARALGADVLEPASAGTRPRNGVNPWAVQVMREAGVDISGARSKGVAELGDARWDLAITMGCYENCPVANARRVVDWAIPDPKGRPIEEFRNVRDEIRARVERLICGVRDEVENLL